MEATNHRVKAMYIVLVRPILKQEENTYFESLSALFIVSKLVFIVLKFTVVHKNKTPDKN